MSRKQVSLRAVHPVEHNRDALRRALDWLLEERIFEDLALHGNTSWRPVEFVALTLLWVWSSKHALTEAFTEAHTWSKRLLGRSALDSYQGLVGALVTWTPKLLPLLLERIHRLMEESCAEHWRVGRWCPLAVDGSRGDMPRTRGNEARFCAKNYGHGVTAKYRKKKSKGMRRKRNRQSPGRPARPQMWITLLWHMGLRLPWSWKLGPSDSNERRHFIELLDAENFPENTLFCGDAGFVGYDFWRAIVDSGNQFLIRVGGNVKLLKKLGHVRQRDGLVYSWPNQAMQKKQPPLVLRLVRLSDGRKPIYLLTSVLVERELSHPLTARLYRQRWGIEVQFRSLKQTFGRGSLRSRNPDRALMEMEWSLLGLSVIQLWAVHEQLQAGLLPEHLSVAAAIRAVRQCFEELRERPREGQDLRSRLLHATIDSYQRTSSKAARFKPKSYTIPVAGRPVVSIAKRRHNTHLRKHFPKLAA
jgi:hypothetical protein